MNRTPFTCFLALTLLALPACGDKQSSLKSPGAVGDEEQEITPDEFATEMGLSKESSNRTVPKSEFKNYSMVVDIFRSSRTLPVLGEYDSSYQDLLVPPSVPPANRDAEARKTFSSLSKLEIAVVSLDGTPYKAQVISGGLEGYVNGSYKTTPPGNYRLDPIRYSVNVNEVDALDSKELIPYPWLRSQKYGNSRMYWGLWIFGGYFFHSTSHYWQLGRRASMGCIRQSFPDSMENFQLAQDYRAMIRIHPIGSTAAYDRLREITRVSWVLPRILHNDTRVQESIQDIGREVITLGHAWRDPATGMPGIPVWPRCGAIGCFKIWGKKEPKNLAYPPENYAHYR